MNTSPVLVTIIAFFTLFLSSCGTSGYEPIEEEEEEKADVTPSEEVAPDGKLETVTWNIEWYGSDFSGPEDYDLQTRNIVSVMDSLQADLYTLQEVADQESLENILQHLSGYRGFVAGHVSQQQKMGFIYNTNTIDSLNAGAIKDDLREDYQNDWSYYWANGREPLFFEFTYRYEDTEIDLYVTTVHGKANTSPYEESYKRRKGAGEGLYYYLTDHKPDANIILLGDYNDDVDESIYYEDDPEQMEKSPYLLFVDDSSNFTVLTKPFSDAGESASVNDDYKDLIDHITISDELFDFHIDNSTEIIDAEAMIPDYEATTSDHLPVQAIFDVTVEG